MATTLKKSLYAFLIVLILIILPYTTWVALQKGEAYLIDTVRDIKNSKDSLDNYVFLYNDNIRIDTITQKSFEGQVILFFNAQDFNDLKSNLLLFDEQMKKADNLQFIQLYTSENPPNDYSEILNIPIRNMLDTKGFGRAIKPNLIGIVDTKGKLRNTYGSNKKDFIMIIKHLALLLPRIERGK